MAAQRRPVPTKKRKGLSAAAAQAVAAAQARRFFVSNCTFPHCGAIFSDDRSLQKHVREIHGITRYNPHGHPANASAHHAAVHHQRHHQRDDMYYSHSHHPSKQHQQQQQHQYLHQLQLQQQQQQQQQQQHGSMHSSSSGDLVSHSTLGLSSPPTSTYGTTVDWNTVHHTDPMAVFGTTSSSISVMEGIAWPTQLESSSSININITPADSTNNMASSSSFTGLDSLAHEFATTPPYVSADDIIAVFKSQQSLSQQQLMQQQRGSYSSGQGLLDASILASDQWNSSRLGMDAMSLTPSGSMSAMDLTLVTSASMDGSMGNNMGFGSTEHDFGADDQQLQYYHHGGYSPSSAQQQQQQQHYADPSQQQQQQQFYQQQAAHLHS